MTEDEIKSRFRSYIDCINAGTMREDLPKYCHPHVTHNDSHYTLEQYRDLIQSSKDAIPDLHFSIDTLLYDDASQKLAVRLLFTGTPTHAVAGKEPTGQKVHFSEHVFYQLQDGKIAQVWSLVDWDAVRLQLSSSIE